MFRSRLMLLNASMVSLPSGLKQRWVYCIQSENQISSNLLKLEILYQKNKEHGDFITYSLSPIENDKVVLELWWIGIKYEEVKIDTIPLYFLWIGGGGGGCLLLDGKEESKCVRNLAFQAVRLAWGQHFKSWLLNGCKSSHFCSYLTHTAYQQHTF